MSHIAGALGVATFVLASPQAFSQQLLNIYPSYAVARLETRFTVEGVALPTEDSPNAGLKLSTVPPGSCENARRYKAATPDRYYFACTFAPTQAPVVVRIHHKTGGKSDLVASYNIPVMAGPPQLSQITISGNAASSGARVRCEVGATCVTLAGDLVASDSISVEAKGSNLPPELYVDVQGCATPLAKAQQAGQPNDTRQISCAVVAGAAMRKVRLLSAPLSRGGEELWQIELGAASR